MFSVKPPSVRARGISWKAQGFDRSGNASVAAFLRVYALPHRMPHPRLSAIPAQLSRVRLRDQRRQRHRHGARRGQRPRGSRAAGGPQSGRRRRQPHAQRNLCRELGRGGSQRLDLSHRRRAQRGGGHNSAAPAAGVNRSELRREPSPTSPTPAPIRFRSSISRSRREMAQIRRRRQAGCCVASRPTARLWWSPTRPEIQ